MNIEKQNKIAIFAITTGGIEVARRIRSQFNCDCYTGASLKNSDNISFSDDSMKRTVAEVFNDYDLMVFVCATGIVVRMIAPLLLDKFEDPAVLVIDEQATFVISLLSGHIGGANAWTREIAALLQATPVITTATDVQGKRALDLMIQEVNADPAQHRQAIKTVNQMLVNGGRVGLYAEEVILSATTGLITVTDLTADTQNLDLLVMISIRQSLPQVDPALPVVVIRPKKLVLGVGCRKDTSFEHLYRLLTEFLNQNNLAEASLAEIGSVAIKADEAGLIALSRHLQIPFRTFAVAELKCFEDLFPKSAFVQQTINVGSVSQPVAWILSGGRLIGEVFKKSGVTFTLGLKE